MVPRLVSSGSVDIGEHLRVSKQRRGPDDRRQGAAVRWAGITGHGRSDLTVRRVKRRYVAERLRVAVPNFCGGWKADFRPGPIGKWAFRTLRQINFDGFS